MFSSGFMAGLRGVGLGIWVTPATPSTLAPSSTSVVDVHAAPASLEGVVSRTVHDLVFGAPLTEQSTPEQVNARLYDAAYAGDVMTLLDAIFLGGNPLARNEGAGNSAIHAAAAGGHARALELLLRDAPQQGSALQNARGNTPLHMVAGRIALDDNCKLYGRS